MRALRDRCPSPAMIVAIIALIAALAGTAYAAQTINGGAIKKQTIGGGKLKQKTLTGFQINTNKLGTVPSAQRASHTYWAVVNNPAGPGNAALARASDQGISAIESGGAVSVVFPSGRQRLRQRRRPQQRGHDRTRRRLRPDQRRAGQRQRGRSPHPQRQRRQRRRRLPPDRHLPLSKSCPRQWVIPGSAPPPQLGRAGAFTDL